MTRLLLKKFLNESLLLLAACGGMLLLFCWARVWILCQFDLQQFAPLLDQFRPFEKYMPVPLEQLLTYQGALAMTFQEPVLILCVLVWSIARGSDVVSGEINRGTMEMVLAQPVGRLQLLVSHAAVCVLGLALLCSLAWLGLAGGIHTNSVLQRSAPTVDIRLPFLPLSIPIRTGPISEIEVPLASQVDATEYLAPLFNLFGFGFFVLALSVMCSSFDRFRWRTLGIVIGIYIVQLLLFLLSKATEATAFCGYLTFFSAYQPDAIVNFAGETVERGWWLWVPQASRTASWPSGWGPLALTLLLVALGLLFYGIAAFRFRTRDIPAPL